MSTRTRAAGEDAGRSAAPAPAASPRARWWAILLGLVFLGIAAVAVHDLLVVKDKLSASAWLDPVYDWFADVDYGDWTLPAAIGCGVVALILLVATLRPRARTHLDFAGDAGLHARPVDVARMSTAAARRAGGVLDASTVATRKKITVTVRTAAGDEAERDAVSDAVSSAVSGLADLLDPTPSVAVRLRAPEQGGDRR